MSRIFEALKKSNMEVGAAAAAAPAPELDDRIAAPQPEQATMHSMELDSCPAFSIKTNGQARLVSITEERSIGAEKMRVVATRMRHLRTKKQYSTVLVTSSMKGEGKSMMAANLALTFAKQVRRETLIIDCDLRCPTLHSMFGVESSPGLVDWWEDDLPLDRVLRKHPELPLWFLAAGRVAEQPLEILQSQRFADLIARVGGLFHWVLLDSPPLTPMADSSVLCHLAEGVLLIVRQGVTSASVLRTAMDSLERKKLLGVVVNESSNTERRYYDQYYK